MRSNLLPSVAIVFLFWWSVLAITALFNGHVEWSYLFFSDIGKKMSLSALAFIWGGVLTASYLIAIRYYKKGELVSAKHRGITVSLGPFPIVTDPLPRLPLEQPFPKRLDLWVASHDQKSYKPHLDLLYAIAETLEAHPLVPAGRTGDHGDHTLRKHSYNVTEAILEVIANGFTYRGLAKKPRWSPKPIMYFPPDDPLFQLLIHDPLIPLAGLAHDLGKIEAYQLDDMGEYKLVRKDHDHRGQMILARFPEFWRLPEDDQQPLLDIVGFYHHFEDLPQTSEERARALIAALRIADDTAGRRENQNPVKISAEETQRLLKRTQDAKKKAGQVVNKIIATREEEVTPDFDLPEGQELSKFHARLIEAFDALIVESNRINGSSATKRLGIKKGKYLYLQENKVIESVAERIGAPHLAITRKTQQRENVISSNLLNILHKRGVLYRRHGGYEYPPQKAVFKLEMITNNGELKVIDLPRVIVIKADTYPELRMHRDVPFKIKELYPSYSITAATNKGKPGPENPEDENAAEPDAGSPAAPFVPTVLAPEEAKVIASGTSPDLFLFAEPTESMSDSGETNAADAENPDAEIESYMQDETAVRLDGLATDELETDSSSTQEAGAEEGEGENAQAGAGAAVRAGNAPAAHVTPPMVPGFVASDEEPPLQDPALIERFVQEAANQLPAARKPSKARRRQMEVSRQSQEHFREGGGAASGPTDNLSQAEKLVLEAVRTASVDLKRKTYDGKEYYLVNLSDLLAETEMTDEDRANFMGALKASLVVTLRAGASGNVYASVPI